MLSAWLPWPQGVCLNIEQMAKAFLESELLYLTGPEGGNGEYELDGDIADIKLPTNLVRRRRVPAEYPPSTR